MRHRPMLHGPILQEAAARPQISPVLGTVRTDGLSTFERGKRLPQIQRVLFGPSVMPRFYQTYPSRQERNSKADPAARFLRLAGRNTIGCPPSSSISFCENDCRERHKHDVTLFYLLPFFCQPHWGHCSIIR